MKNIFKLMMIIAVGLMIFQSCQEGETSMPDMGPGAVKVLTIDPNGDPMIPFLEPSSFTSGFTLDVIADNAVGSIDIWVEMFRVGAGTRDTAFYVAQTTFPQTHALDLQDLADLFPDDSDDILNNLDGGDYFKVFTGNIIMADGTEIFEEYEFEVQDTTEAGEDTLVTLGVAGYSPALANITNAGVWLNQLTYFVGCPTDLAGLYTMVTNGTNTDGSPPAVDHTITAEIVHNGGLAYTIDQGFGGVYSLWYCGPYGYCWDNAQVFLDICGELQATFADSWGMAYPIDGSVDEATGVITYHYINAWGDELTSVLTPQ